MPREAPNRDGIVEVPLHDFSGGYTPRKASTEFTDRQWAELYGVVIESPSVLRTQWALQRVGVSGVQTGQHPPFVWLANIGGRRLVAGTEDGEVWTTIDPLSWQTYQVAFATEWTKITEIDADPLLQPLCTVRMKPEDGEGHTAGLLLNHASSGSAYVIRVDPPLTNQFTVEEWEHPGERYAGSDPTEGVMPRANVGTMWGDFLVLGDIHWIADEAEGAHSASNTARYENALWFSEGGQIDHWSPLGVVQLPMSSHNNRVLDLIPIDAGLLCFTEAGVFLLRGTPDEFDVEPIRWGLPGRLRRGATYWPYVGAVAWVDNAGQVWMTNGEDFTRLDTHLFWQRDAGPFDHARPWGEFLLVHRHGRMFCFRAFDDDGAWTELVIPNAGIRDMRPIGDQLYFLDNAGSVWRFNRREDLYETEEGNVQGDPAMPERGRMHFNLVTPRIATRTIEASDGHGVNMWHRFGFRAEGPGSVKWIDLRPGPALASGPHLRYTLEQTVAERHEIIVPGHGPSVEASATVEFSGDVSVEQVSWWHHKGRGSR